MALSIEEILGFVPLTKAIETVKAGTPRLLPPAFYNRNPAFRLNGDKTRRIETAGTRKNAKILPYGAPPRQIEHLPLDGRDIILMHTEEKITFSHELFLQIREYENYVLMQKLAEEARRQIKNAVDRQMNLETSAIALMLANGKLWFADGELLGTSSGADQTIDYLVPANNTGQLNGIIDASWAIASTNIPTQLKKIRERARFTTGFPLKYAFYGKNVMGYLLQNTFCQSYLTSYGGAKWASEFLERGELPPKFMDFEWIAMNESFFDSEAGVTTEVWNEDLVVFTPDPADENVYGVYEGSYPVLNKFDITSDITGQMSSWDYKPGRYGYGYPMFPPEPLGIAGVYGDTFLPCLMTPAAFYFADTTP